MNGCRIAVRRTLTIVAASVMLAGSTAATLPGRDDEGYPTTLTAPQYLAGLSKTNDPNLQQLAKELTTDLMSGTNATSSVAAFYEDPIDRTKLVAVVGATAYLENPGAELADAISGATTQDSVTDLRDVDPGPLDGVARCGHTTQDRVVMVLCGWADNGSLAITFFFDRSIEESAQLLLKMRAAMTHR